MDKNILQKLKDILNNEENLSDADIVDMMFTLVENCTKYAIKVNTTKTNYIARELFENVFEDETLNIFDEE